MSWFHENPSVPLTKPIELPSLRPVNHVPGPAAKHCRWRRRFGLSQATDRRPKRDAQRSWPCRVSRSTCNEWRGHKDLKKSKHHRLKDQGSCVEKIKSMCGVIYVDHWAWRTKVERASFSPKSVANLLEFKLWPKTMPKLTRHWHFQQGNIQIQEMLLVWLVNINSATFGDLQIWQQLKVSQSDAGLLTLVAS